MGIVTPLVSSDVYVIFAEDRGQRFPIVRETLADRSGYNPFVGLTPSMSDSDHSPFRHGVVMGYGDFTFDSLLAEFNLSVVQAPLFAPPSRIEPSPWLLDTLQKGRGIAFYSEKSRSEFIVVPVLLACQEMLRSNCCLYSGVRLDVDADKGLKGECDFILAKTPPGPALRAPLLVVVEAKKNDIEEGLAQCAAQMVAARLFNEHHKEVVPALYGCVTTGETWQFLRLRQQELVVDEDRYYITEVATILGILVTVMKGEISS
mgnify:CR=1 FL=1